MATKRKRNLTVVPDILEGSLLLSAEDAELARIQVALIMHHRQILAQLENELLEKLETGYGANCRAGGGWSLNAAEGRLDRTA